PHRAECTCAVAVLQRVVGARTTAVSPGATAGRELALIGSRRPSALTRNNRVEPGGEAAGGTVMIRSPASYRRASTAELRPSSKMTSPSRYGATTPAPGSDRPMR